MSNIGLELYLKERKVKLLRAPVGDRYVVEAMRAGKYNFGGEQSGHLIFLDHATTGDGALAALQLLGIMVGSGKKLSELGRELAVFPQMLHNIRMKHRVPLESMKGFRKAQAEFEKALGSRGRIVVRYSGTEPLLRIMVEGENPDVVEEIVNALSEKAREESR
jgi:phosphoglucosamine mutase